MSRSNDPSRIAEALNAAAEHYAAGRLDEAAALYEWVEMRATGDLRPVYSLAVIDLRRQRFDHARRRLKTVLRWQADHFAAAHNLGVAEQARGAWPLAASAYRQAVAIRPDAAESWFSLAIAEAVLGHVDEAISLYRSLAVEPAHRPRALSRLAILRPAAITDEELDVLTSIAQSDVVEDTRIEALFALAGVLERRRHDAAAWAAFELGNHLKHKSLECGPKEARPAAVARDQVDAVAQVRSLYTADFVAAHAGRGDPGAGPIFILGMPRSGSSLIEQILSSHPQVQGMGESDCLARTTAHLSSQDTSTASRLFQLRRLARDYLGRQTRRGWDGRSRPADKTLDNHLHVGLIHSMFPRATILVARRDPLDVGLACFRQLFTAANETLYDLSHIAAEILRYEEVMEHWRAVLPGRVFEVRYEHLVAEPEFEIRRLITEGCDLPWSPACLDFHKTNSVVATASADQVRRPIFTDPVGRWRRYEAQLAPLRDGLRQ